MPAWISAFADCIDTAVTQVRVVWVNRAVDADELARVLARVVRDVAYFGRV